MTGRAPFGCARAWRRAAAGSGSYQLAYVLHPATMWKELGPIHLTVRVPKGVRCGAYSHAPPVAWKDGKLAFDFTYLDD